MTKERRKFQPLKSGDICIIYQLLSKRNLIPFDLSKSSVNSVDALVSNITGEYFGEQIYKTPEEKAVAYLYFIIKSHPFVDGNKRTAVLSFEVVCNLNDLESDDKGFGLDAIAVFVEGHKGDHQDFINRLAQLLFS